MTGVSDDVVADALAVEPSIAERLSVLPNGIPAPSTRARRRSATGPPAWCASADSWSRRGSTAPIARSPSSQPAPPGRGLTVAGAGPQRGELVTLAADLGIVDRVDFLGAIDDVCTYALLESATVVVMPSHFEGLPLVVLEAAWMARPVVGAAVPGLSLVVRDGVTGTLVEGNDDVALAADVLAAARERPRPRTSVRRRRGGARRDRILRVALCRPV